MMEYDMKRNGSGYYDETPVKTGLFNGPQPGEIWESSYHKEFLILKNHGGYCTTLALNDNPHEETVEVVSRTVRYTNPGMVGYSFCNQFVQFIKTIPEEEYMAIMEAVGDRLGVTIKVNRAADNGHGAPDYEGLCKDLKHQLEEASREIDCVVKERNAIREELLECQQKASHADVVAAVKADMYETLYKDLLQKCLARGEAK